MSGTKRSTCIPWLSKCICFPGTETHTRVKELHYCSLKYSHQEPKCLAGAFSSLYWSLAQTQLHKSQIHITDSSKLLIAPFSDNIYSTEAIAASATQQHRSTDLLGKFHNTPKYLSLAQLKLLSPRRMSKREYIVECRSPEQIVPTNPLFYLKDQQIWVLRTNLSWQAGTSKTRPHNTAKQYHSAVQLCSTISRTLRLYSRRFSLYMRAASEFAGELGLGSHSKDWIEVRIAATS